MTGNRSGLFILIVLVMTAFQPADRSHPTLFAEGIVSTAHDEFGSTFTPDGKTCFFAMKSPSTIINDVNVICVSNFQNGGWGKPEIASFSGKYQDFNPSLSPDGSKLFFVSSRPADETAGKKRYDTDLWVVERSGAGWGEPRNLGEPINTRGWELGCSVTSEGTLYFSSTGTTGNADLYRSRLVKGIYQKPELLDSMINSPYSETDPFIDPAGKYLLFACQGRPDALTEPGASVSYPRADLYISIFRDGKWSAAKNLGAAINSTAEESNPWVSADGKTFYFTSERNFVSIPMKQKLDYATLEKNLRSPTNGLGNIYEVDTDALFSGQNK